MIKIAWSGHSPGEEEGEEKKQRRRRRKRRRKWKKERRKDNRYLNGKYNFFNECFNCSWIFIFTSVLWTFNKAVFTRREVWRSGDGEERREEVKIFPYGRLLLDFKAKRILAKFEAKGTKKERNMNIGLQINRAKRNRRKKEKNTSGKISFIEKKRNEGTSLRLSEIIPLLWLSWISLQNWRKQETNKKTKLKKKMSTVEFLRFSPIYRKEIGKNRRWKKFEKRTKLWEKVRGSAL